MVPGKDLTERPALNITEGELGDMAELFKLFGDSTRIKILYVLSQGERNVTDICAALEMNQSAVSHQLKLLKTARLVSARRSGKQMIYRLADEHVKTIIAMGREHVLE
jgi:ArsR family transcriptional regulator